MQLDAWERGFSYSYDAPLDMRMDPTPGARARRGRQRVAGGAARDDDPRATARSATRARSPPRSPAGARSRPPPSWSRRSAPRSRRPTASAAAIPAKRTFQAIRIAVNGELDSLDRGAAGRPGSCSRTGGRLGAISFHSLEDRPREALPRRPRARLRLPARAAGLRLRPRARGRAARRGGAVKPSEAEIERNPRSRSARLRVARKLADAGSPPHDRRKPAEVTDGGQRDRKRHPHPRPARRAPARRSAPARKRASGRTRGAGDAPPYRPDARRRARPGRRRRRRGRRDRRLGPVRPADPRPRSGSACSARCWSGSSRLNVIALSFSASSSNAGQAADALKRQNSALRAQIAGRLSNSRDPAGRRARSAS